MKIQAAHTATLHDVTMGNPMCCISPTSITDVFLSGLGAKYIKVGDIYYKRNTKGERNNKNGNQFNS